VRQHHRRLRFRQSQPPGRKLTGPRGRPNQDLAFALRFIQQTSGDVPSVEEGALYPALHRLELRGLVGAAWGVSENNRRAKYYRLNPAGRKYLSQEASAWSRLSRDADGVRPVDRECFSIVRLRVRAPIHRRRLDRDLEQELA
jgi:DNA-binding PadR family transcriptional regulator